MAWAKATVMWKYDLNQIWDSYGSQEKGFIFPNTVKLGGIAKQQTSVASYHIYKSDTTLGAGTVTPWGAINIYEVDFADYIKVDKLGNHTIY
ncbi:hypothetical protein SAMN04487969_14628 [Paenibacillus algorifonticola]|uniref:Uncharacterized protein n=1 Tax=Paenibacillus algorifonticola TaxID=684063 RepID=A0A1I2IZY8_9BACL|nr:hypothetical protein [Paenibacillus algorifonticola]SFF47153.1 hypothetical protein SAMN04487969_14628 [Paenibacillus algorifonticola]